MNRGGFLRIVEASIAIVIIMSALFVVRVQTQSGVQLDYSERARKILDEVSKDPMLRMAVLQQSTTPLELFVDQKIPESHLSYEIRICEDILSVCGKETVTRGQVWVGERIVSATVTTEEFEPKKIKLFIWETEDG